MSVSVGAITMGEIAAGGGVKAASGSERGALMRFADGRRRSRGNGSFRR